MEELTEFKKKYSNPFDGIDKESVFQKKCEEIAKDLFEHYYIQCDETKYYFAEIEFYYFNENSTILNKRWNTLTYPRENKSAGEMFYHLSGVDICFESNLLKDNKTGELKGKGGGILIRSLTNEARTEVVAGPINCVNTMLNACCEKRKMPYLQYNKSVVRDVKMHSTFRYLGKKDFDLINKKSKKGNIDGWLKLAFFDGKINSTVWNTTKSTSTYNKKRFKYDNNKPHTSDI